MSAGAWITRDAAVAVAQIVLARAASAVRESPDAVVAGVLVLELELPQALIATVSARAASPPAIVVVFIRCLPGSEHGRQSRAASLP